jgi:hypothetical protein
MMSEYGCDAVPGLHSDPPFAFTEEFQSEYVAQVAKQQPSPSSSRA